MEDYLIYIVAMQTKTARINYETSLPPSRNDIYNLFNATLPEHVFENIFTDIYFYYPKLFTNWFLNPKQINIFTEIIENLKLQRDKNDKKIEKKQNKLDDELRQIEYLLAVIDQFNQKKLSLEETKSVLSLHDKYIDKKKLNSINTEEQGNILMLEFTDQLHYAWGNMPSQKTSLKRERNAYNDEIDTMLKKYRNLLEWNHLVFKVHIADNWNDTYTITYPDWRH